LIPNCVCNYSFASAYFSEANATIFVKSIPLYGIPAIFDCFLTVLW